MDNHGVTTKALTAASILILGIIVGVFVARVGWVPGGPRIVGSILSPSGCNLSVTQGYVAAYNAVDLDPAPNVFNLQVYYRDDTPARVGNDWELVVPQRAFSVSYGGAPPVGFLNQFFLKNEAGALRPYDDLLAEFTRETIQQTDGSHRFQGSDDYSVCYVRVTGGNAYTVLGGNTTTQSSTLEYADPYPDVGEDQAYKVEVYQFLQTGPFTKVGEFSVFFRSCAVTDRNTC
jgi:hypothetical protein